MKIRQPSFERLEWIVILGLGVVATAVAAVGIAGTSTVLLVTAAVLAVGVAAEVVRAERHNDEERRPVGLLILIGAQLGALIVAVLIGADTTIMPSVVRSQTLPIALFFAATVAAVVGIDGLISHRLGNRPEITGRETAIVSAGFSLMFFVLIAQPKPGDTTADLIGSVVSSASVGLAMFAMLILLWLIGHDKSAVSLPIILTSVSTVALVFMSAVLLVLMVSDSPTESFLFPLVPVLAIIGAVTAASAYLHNDCANAFAPVLMTISEVNVRRSLISFSVVLVGPILIGFDQLTDLDLSLPIITVGSSALSLVVAIHLLGLVRRWVAVEHQGQHDPLTNLPNRPLFFSRLEMAIESARLRDARFVTMFLDLDRFKAVNDTLGHDAGDELLRQVAERLNEASLRVGANLTVARLGGDEFAILVPAVKDARHSHAIGRLFLDQFLEPFDVGLRDIYVTPSIGIAEFPRDGDSVEELIENADTAMFEAKERGRNMVVSYSPEQRVPGAHRLEIEAALHRALENEELQLYYQPQIDITTGRIFAVEALLRWEHPTLGMISPEKFVPVAEESTLIDSIGQWILDEACRAAAHWVDIGLPPINVAVNLSPRQFQKSVHLTDNVTRALRTSGLPPGRLELELTETIALEKPEEVNATLSRFREMGTRTAIDDFGVGHTGLDYLDRIIVDTLKIDRSFINRIGESGAPLVTAVISLARGLNLDVIAEGVETRAQVNFLKSHGCRYMQGFLFSKPLTAAQLEQVLRNQRARVNVAQGRPADAPSNEVIHGAGHSAAAAAPASANVVATPPALANETVASITAIDGEEKEDLGAAPGATSASVDNAVGSADKAWGALTSGSVEDAA